MRKLIWVGILTPLAVLCFMNSACGGYSGWPGKSTEGTDAKLAGDELSVSGGTGPFALENGLWTFYVNYNNVGGQNVKEVSTYRDSTAPFGVFTSDGNGQQYFNDHVGVKVTAAVDTNGDGRVDGVGGIAIDISQAGMKEAASKLADLLATQPAGATAVTLTFSSGASLTVHIAGGPAAAVPLRTYAGS